ncbi:hypothetical protein [Georgenia yuyongxinii]|uniref:Uncharacterized protein n=1 Tax=Georgenia yuyongxinii TaxID=2589797 RepID=A0A552WL11_9MICO|nr:hypothetical protein [Georgenia yuyongxinii]TRW43437.1 hypothetical protein FJ693_17700 [Georgenia yuyongxinii]
MSLPDPASPTGRAVRALRTTLLACAGACFALGVMGVAVALLTEDTSALWPGATLLGAGQLAMLVAAAVAGLGLRAVVRGAEPRPVTTRVRRHLATVRTVLAVVLALGVVAWIVVRPSAVVAVVATGLVSAQAAVLLHLLRR